MARFRGFDGERLETPLPDEVAVVVESRLDLIFLLAGIMTILTLLAITQP